MTDADAQADRPEDTPEWDDEYIDALALRLQFNYDLEKDRPVRGERFELYGHMEFHSQKHFLHPAISFAHQEAHEHLFVRRQDRVTEADLDRLVELGHDLADEWIDPHEEHYSTEFTFGLVVPSIPDDVRSRIAGLDERTLLKLGYNGHYEVNLLAVSPEKNELVANDAVDVETAFRTWEPIETEEPGLLDLIARRFQL